MATQGRFTVFSDENGGSKADQPAGVKTRRAPLGVLSDANQIDRVVPLKPGVVSSQINSQKADRAPLCDENSLKPKPTAAIDKENQATTTVATDKENQATTTAAVRPKAAAAKVEQLQQLALVREPFKVLDVSMGSPMPLGSPMIVSPLPETPKAHGKDWQEELLDDLFFTREYGKSHYAYLRDLESRLKPRPDYMTRQRDISSTMRSVLIDWLVEVNEEYKMSDETLFLAVSLIDRFLSVMSVVRGKLQLVGTAAMFIAAKVEEIYPPQLNEFVYITDDTYSSQQIIRMEALLLKTLGFSLGGAHPLAFLRRFAIEAGASLKVAHMAQYICELSLLRSASLAYRPSEIGAASLILAMHHVDHSIKAWSQELRDFADLDADQLQLAIDHLHEVVSGATASAHKATPEKYAHQKMSSVSLLPLQTTPPRI
ncbi:cyclin-A2-like [Tropilaelaps mercedesae]|uniref:Cyclin-A2-like n=1 Tax=Tropilaelaps mercedesae TaxID=418985 RepID=A0A1V9X0G5_9ACAR|nr:cyclin-A2-like [Tropilaelaps mercedesae]